MESRIFLSAVSGSPYSLIEAQDVCRESVEWKTEDGIEDDELVFFDEEGVGYTEKEILGLAE